MFILDLHTGKTEVEFKEVSPQELERIKVEIRKKARKDRLKDLDV